MGQIHGANLGSPAVIVTSKGELLTTGSIAVASSIDSGRTITTDQVLSEINNKITILINHMEIINDTTIREVETEE